MQPFLVYYLQYKDEALLIPYWNTKQDYVCCVMAEDTTHAIQKTRTIATKGNDSYVKIMGIATGKEEWVNEKEPLCK